MKHIKLLIVLGLMTAASTAFALGCESCGCGHSDGVMHDDVKSEAISFSCGFPWIHFCCDECDDCCE